jgi:hypothetical protein
LHILLSKSGNWNKSNNSNEERIDFLLQNQWNNFTNGRSEQFAEKD